MDDKNSCRLIFKCHRYRPSFYSLLVFQLLENQKENLTPMYHTKFLIDLNT